MKRKSIRRRIVLFSFVSITLTAVIILLIASISIRILSTRDSEQLIEHIAREHANKFNMELDGMEHAVDSIYFYAQDQLDEAPERIYDESFRSEYLGKVEEIALSEARNTSSVEVVYYRLTTDITEGEKGFLYSKNSHSDRFQKQTLTTIEDYAEDDIEHVGWYYLPKNEGRAIWIGPYQNKNLDIRMMSYVVPLYSSDSFIGVIGMDIDVTALSRELNTIQIYDTGSAAMFDADGNIAFYKDYPDGLKAEDFSPEDQRMADAMRTAIEEKHAINFKGASKEQKLYATPLDNGMTLCILVPLDEINATQITVTLTAVAISTIIIIVSLIIAIMTMNRFLQPLTELITASRQLADGNMDVTITRHENDEIGDLAETFDMMAGSLRKYFDHFHSLAYTDSLTGLNNKAAYEITRDVIVSEIRMGRASFSIIVMDVNNLKTINDTLGHDKGDLMLQHVVKCMRETFIGYPLYRIGGDEFCCIISRDDPTALIEHLQSLTAKSSEADKELFDGCTYQIAAGSASYDKNAKDTFEDVFHRADNAMYENKRKLKGEGTNT